MSQLGENVSNTVGVVLTTYNGEPYIKAQLESILDQTVQPYRIVVVDDGSTDRTAEIVEEYAGHHAGIRLFRNRENLGWVKNFAKAISLCDTDYIALSDQDDVWHPQKLEICVRTLAENPLAGLCYHNAGLMYADGTKLKPNYWEISPLAYPLSKKDGQDVLLRLLTPSPGFTLTFTRQLKFFFEPFPGYACVGHDWWICAIAFFLFDPIVIEESLVTYRLHHKQASGAGSCLLADTEYRLGKKIFDAARIRRNIRRIVKSVFKRQQIKMKKFNDARDRALEFRCALERLQSMVKNQGAVFPCDDNVSASRIEYLDDLQVVINDINARYGENGGVR